MLNVKEVEDAILQARNKFNKMYGEIINEYMEPYNDLAKALLLRSVDPKQKEELNKRIPKAMTELEKKYGKEN